MYDICGISIVCYLEIKIVKKILKYHSCEATIYDTLNISEVKNF